MMHLLEVSFTILQYCGFWRPIELRGWRTWLYNTYTAFMVFTIYSVTLLQLIELLRSTKNIQEFTHNALILLTTVNACAKGFNLLRSRNAIISIVNLLTNPPCSFRDKTEEIIQNDFNQVVK